MSKAIKTSFYTKRFNTGTICQVKVPEDKMNTHGAFHNAYVEVISKKDFIRKFKDLKVPGDKVTCRIIRAPNAKDPARAVGMEYALTRKWLMIEKAGKPKCGCDLRTVLMVSGCVCGGA